MLAPVPVVASVQTPLFIFSHHWYWYVPIPPLATTHISAIAALWHNVCDKGDIVTVGSGIITICAELDIAS